MGGRVLGACDVEPGPTLYLALEDTARRLQNRARRLLGNEQAPPTAHLHTSWPRMGEGGADMLADHLAAHPDTRVVAVDVLSKVRDLAGADRGQYDADYAAISTFKKLADHYGVALLVNHHDRKAKDADWLSTVSGTRGVTGAADAVMLLTKPRGTADGQLSVTGRDIEEAQHALRFDTGQWLMLNGPVQAYTTSATRARILKLLMESPNLKPSEVADRLDGLSRDNAKQTLTRMREAGQVRSDGDGRYRLDGDWPEPVIPVTESPSKAVGAVTGDGSDTFSGVTPASRKRRRGDPEPLVLRTVTGCDIEEWLAGIDLGYPSGTGFEALDLLRDFCDECLDEGDEAAQTSYRPQAIDPKSMVGYYYCGRGHAWISLGVDLACA